MNLILEIQKSIKTHYNSNAFCISQKFYTYKELAQKISDIRLAIRENIPENQIIIGLVTNDDIETYAGIIALWMERKAYLPLNPDFPENRLQLIIKMADVQSVLDSSEKPNFETLTTIATGVLPTSEIDLKPKNITKENLAYVFFTSGTTGTPKGVPITFENLSAFVDAFNDLSYPINKEDRCLQMFDLTFDLSVMSYLCPMLQGACMYTIPKDEIKYSYIFELMEDHRLTYALMVPSILQYLRSYFDEIHCPDMKYSLFCGEALPLDVTQEWSQCLPNATIANVYGPTECTIFCTDYTFKRGTLNKMHNGVLSIGKDMKNTQTIIVDEKNEEVDVGAPGELCLSGEQLTSGYWKNQKKNEAVFFYKQYKGNTTRFYRTGDVCSKDKEGDILYLGRVDFQAKIQGFRVELSEIEFQAKNHLDKINVVAVAFTNAIQNTEVGLVIQSTPFEYKELLDFMKTKLPAYMIPTKVRFVENFPLNTNGKVDRKKLITMFG